MRKRIQATVLLCAVILLLPLQVDAAAKKKAVTTCKSGYVLQVGKCVKKVVAPVKKAATPAKKPVVKAAPAASCVIKGNISAKKEKIFHVPGCPNYGQTVIDTTAGEQIFCSESEALAAGWRKALNCP